MDETGAISIPLMLNKFDLMAKDLHLMATCIDHLRLITIILVVTGYLCGIGYGLYLLNQWRQSRRNNNSLNRNHHSAPDNFDMAIETPRYRSRHGSIKEPEQGGTSPALLYGNGKQFAALQ